MYIGRLHQARQVAKFGSAFGPSVLLALLQGLPDLCVVLVCVLSGVASCTQVISNIMQ
jgi:hypothetical protein